MMKSKRGPGRPPVAKSIKEFLSSPATKKLFEEGKAQVQEGGGGFAEYDDGKYRGQVVSATIGRSQASGRWQHVMGFKFLEGEYKGQVYFQYQGLENPMGFTVLLAQFAKMGIEIEDQSDLEAADKQVVKEKPIVDFRLRTKGEFQNLLVLKVVDADEATEDEEAEETTEEDIDSDEDEKDEEVEATKEESDDEDEEEAEEKPSKKTKVVATEDDDEDEEDEDEDSEEEDEDEEEDEEEKPAPKKAAKKKEVEPEDDEDEDESDEDDEEEEKDEEKVTLDVGTKVKIKYEDENVVGKIVKVDEEKSRIKVKLKSGAKVWVNVPDDVIDVV